MFIRKSEKKGIITLGILIMALFVLPQAIHKNECPVFLIPYSQFSDTTHSLPQNALQLNSIRQIVRHWSAFGALDRITQKRSCVTGNNWVVFTLHDSSRKLNFNT